MWDSLWTRCEWRTTPIYVARTSRNRVSMTCDLFAATMWSFVHLLLRLSNLNNVVLLCDQDMQAVPGATWTDGQGCGVGVEESESDGFSTWGVGVGVVENFNDSDSDSGQTFCSPTVTGCATNVGKRHTWQFKQLDPTTRDDHGYSDRRQSTNLHTFTQGPFQISNVPWAHHATYT